MNIYVYLFLFILGVILGSVFNIIAYRLPIGESLLKRKSHCPFCNHVLSFKEIIPILSYVFLKGKCKVCHRRISLTYPFFELITGVLFALSYYVFGYSMNLLIALTVISMIIIVVNSDYQYMIINDKILIFFSILLFIEYSIQGGINVGFLKLFNGLIALAVMFIIKLIGDIIFHKESMGGGDVKIMFVFGMIIGFPLAITSIFLASIIGLPISIVLVSRKTDSIVPFGPFLSIAALLLFLTQTTFIDIINLIY